MGRQMPFVHHLLCSSSFPPLPPTLHLSFYLSPFPTVTGFSCPSPPSSSGSGPGHTDTQRAILSAGLSPKKEDCSLSSLSTPSLTPQKSFLDVQLYTSLLPAGPCPRTPAQGMGCRGHGCVAGMRRCPPGCSQPSALPGASRPVPHLPISSRAPFLSRHSSEESRLCTRLFPGREVHT